MRAPPSHPVFKPVSHQTRFLDGILYHGLTVVRFWEETRCLARLIALVEGHHVLGHG